MPRTAKKGFTYYGFDTDHFYDPKVKRLKNKFGMEGWAVFHFIVNEIHRVEGYYMIMDSDGLFDVSDYSRMDEQRIAGIVDYCAELGLFDKGLWRSRQVLTSEEIQNRYMGICKSIHRKPSISDDYLLLNAAAPAATSSPQVAAPCPATHTAPVAEPARSGEKEKDTELMQAIADFKLNCYFIIVTNREHSKQKNIRLVMFQSFYGENKGFALHNQFSLLMLGVPY